MKQEQGEWGVTREESRDINWELDRRQRKINDIHEIVL